MKTLIIILLSLPFFAKSQDSSFIYEDKMFYPNDTIRFIIDSTYQPHWSLSFTDWEVDSIPPSEIYCVDSTGLILIDDDTVIINKKFVHLLHYLLQRTNRF